MRLDGRNSGRRSDNGAKSALCNACSSSSNSSSMHARQCGRRPSASRSAPSTVCTIEKRTSCMANQMRLIAEALTIRAVENATSHVLEYRRRDDRREAHRRRGVSIVEAASIEYRTHRRLHAWILSLVCVKCRLFTKESLARSERNVCAPPPRVRRVRAPS
jgi:hypothetical protein